MTLWYLIGAVVVLGIAILSVIGFSAGAASAPSCGTGAHPAGGRGAYRLHRLLHGRDPRRRSGIRSLGFFCLPLVAVPVALMLWPHFMPGLGFRTSRRRRYLSTRC